jgi:hypothetical protein
MFGSATIRLQQRNHDPPKPFQLPLIGFLPSLISIFASMGRRDVSFK